MDSSLVLSQFPEGFLGKLQIRKSGKVELKLGDIILDVSEGAAFSFLQVMCLHGTVPDGCLSYFLITVHFYSTI